MPFTHFHPKVPGPDIQNPFKDLANLDQVLVNLGNQRNVSLSEISPYRDFNIVIYRYYTVTKKGELKTVSEDKYSRWLRRVQTANNPYSSKRKKYVRSCFRFNLSCYRTEEFWRRYNVSFHDIVRFIKKSKPLTLWFMAIALDLRVLPSSSKRSHWDEQSIEIKGKSAVDKKIEMQLAQLIKGLSTKDTLLCDNDRHKPELPVVKLSHDECEELIKLFGQVQTEYQTTWTWNGVEYVPYQYYNGFIEMCRVVPKEAFVARYGTPSCLRVSTPKFMIQGHEYRDFYESFLIYSDSNNHLKLCPNAPADAKVALLSKSLPVKLMDTSKLMRKLEEAAEKKRLRKEAALVKKRPAAKKKKSKNSI